MGLASMWRETRAGVRRPPGFKRFTDEPGGSGVEPTWLRMLGEYSAPTPEMKRIFSSKLRASASSPSLNALTCSVSKRIRSSAIFFRSSSYVARRERGARSRATRFSFQARLKLSCMLVFAPWAARAE